MNAGCLGPDCTSWTTAGSSPSEHSGLSSGNRCSHTSGDPTPATIELELLQRSELPSPWPDSKTCQTTQPRSSRKALLKPPKQKPKSVPRRHPSERALEDREPLLQQLFKNALHLKPETVAPNPRVLWLLTANLGSIRHTCGGFDFQQSFQGLWGYLDSAETYGLG